MELGELKSGGVYNKEILKLIQKLNISEENVELYKTGFHDMKREHDKLIKDIEKLKHENNNLKQSVSDYKKFAEDHLVSYLEHRAIEDENEKLKNENKALRLQADEYFKLWQEQERKYNKLTEHIRLKALHNPSVSRYKDLMCFINEMEGDTHD
ncbi:hypothetical protein vBSscSF1_56 [Staphylococcus phage vB-SscS-F1]|nr:hypothetical protein vBApySJF1_56 [Arcanobacterium phage vB-ApyS-JF1]